MLVSVIIPTFNPLEYLFTCLKSISNQVLNSKYFEVIIILNGCNEPYKSNIINYSKLHLNKLNIKIHQTNIKGVSNARNIGIENASGKYICFIDDDDIITPTYLNSLLQKADEYSIVMSNVLTFESNLNNLNKDYLSKCFLSNYKKDKISLFKSRSLMSTACCKIIPKKIIANTRFNTKLSNGEDSLFMAKISNKIKNIKFSDNDAIYFRRLRLNSASRVAKSNSFYIKNCIYLFFKYSIIIILHPLSYNHLFISSRIFALFVILFKRITNHTKKTKS